MKSLQRFAIVFALLIAAFTCSDIFAQPGLQRAIQAQMQHSPNLFNINGVEATGVSIDANGNAIVTVYTRNARVQGLPAFLNGVAVRHTVSGEIRVWDDFKPQKGKPNRGGSDPKSRFDREVPIGVSVGAFKLSGTNYCFAGTLGCRLKADYGAGDIRHFVLSNNHVLADQNGGTRGSDQILQPGTLDNNCTYSPGDVIGTLTDYVDLSFDSPNTIDAAIAITDTSLTGFATPPDAYGAPTSTTVFATPGMVVQKYGRTTGLTEGVVEAINVQVDVGYDSGTAFFEDQIMIRGRKKRGKKYVNAPFSDSGDSGALIVTLDNNDPTGLLFAGNSQFTVANPIDVVLFEFSVRQDAVFTIDDGN